MNQKKIYELKETMIKYEKMCCKNINRIIEVMGKDSDNCSLLGKYCKLHIVMEKLCSYIGSCICNEDSVSKTMLSELKKKCKKMILLCNNVEKSVKKVKYIRCKEIKSLSELIIKKF